MRKLFLFLFLFFGIHFFSLVAQTNDTIPTSTNKIELENSNSWSIGAGISNFIMQGDLVSIGTAKFGSFLNFGGYVYADKMFNPLLGLEFKINYSKISGGAQGFSEVYNIVYLNSTKISDNIFFEGTAFGAEMNFILSFSNLYETQAVKWHVSGYFGAGFHMYDSALFERQQDGTNIKLIDFGNNPARKNANRASSIYLSAQMSIKYRLSNRMDLEFRPSWYFNYEDHLDATISNKQDWETFFVTHIGLSIKLGKSKKFTIWDKKSDKRVVEKFKIVDSDGDGVIDELDKEPNTPKGVQVYGNGVAIDSDKDGIQDHLDNCPLKFGPIANKGCPVTKDSDNDGVIDSEDLCPGVPGIKENKGCPKENTNSKTVVENIHILSSNIYFNSSSKTIRPQSIETLNNIAKLIKNVKDINFVIEGHTDNKDKEVKNLLISRQRAEAVRDYLITLGIESSRLIYKGYGETRPKYTNETEEGRQLNRRVEIKPIGNYAIDDPTEYIETLHEVKSGESLSIIAEKYKVKISHIIKLNRLTSTLIKIGQVLKIK